ncbi:MAG: response regulator [Clostridia bacterium]|nr:response regulator [Clostridia bacterium]
MYQAKIKKNRVVTERRRKLTLDAETADITNDLKQQILIVDDSEINREILSEALYGEFRILEAENGKECIDILDEYGTGISLVMLDILMPVADGFEVLAYMNKNHIIDDIPVIMISCADSEAYIRRAYGLGVVDYISRPFDSKIVYQRVTNTIKLYSNSRIQKQRERTSRFEG